MNPEYIYDTIYVPKLNRNITLKVDISNPNKDELDMDLGEFIRKRVKAGLYEDVTEYDSESDDDEITTSDEESILNKIIQEFKKTSN
jgi:hypothetical protein